MRTNLVPLLGGLLLVSSAALAGELSDAKLSLHVQPRAKKVTFVCDSAAPVDVACSQHNTSGTLETRYDVYLVVARVDPSEGIAGVTVGIDYDEDIHVTQWNLCAPLEFPYGRWPEAAGGDRIVWGGGTYCQRSTVPGHEEEGTHAIAGSFYVYAYAPGDLYLTVNSAVLTQPELRITNCSSKNVPLDPDTLPLVRFSESGSEPGVSPCALDPVPVKPTSWGRVKRGTK